MSETIPDDIMEAAAEIGNRVFRADWTDADAVDRIIARAIMAERQRCADIARPSMYLCECCRDTGHAISAAILSTEEQKK